MTGEKTGPPCGTRDAESSCLQSTSLPAGSEVWVSPGKDPSVETWTVHADDGSAQCPALAVAVV